MQACEFLDQIDLDLDIEAPGGRRNDEILAVALDLQMHALEQGLDRRVIERDAEHFARARGAQAHWFARRQCLERHGLLDRAGLTATDIEDEPGGTLQSPSRQVKIDAAFEAVRRIGRKAVAARTSGNRIGRKEGTLEEDLGRFERDATLLSAHDAGKRERTLFICNQQRISRRRNGLLVEQHHLLALGREADVDGALQPGIVEHMQRLTEFEHDVVGHVDQGTDRADAAAREAAHHPVGGRRLGVHATQDASAIARASLRCVEHDRAPRIDGRRNRTHLRRAKGGARDGRHFARDALEAQAVCPVRRQLDGEQRVVEPEVLANVGTDRRILGQRIKTAMVLGQAQLARRAQHPEGLDTAQLGCLDGEVARQHGTDRRARHLHAGGCVRRATRSAAVRRALRRPCTA